MNSQQQTELYAMKRAIELAYRGTGHVSPNPRVGCVVLKDGVIIGEGWHHSFGSDHAEVDAIANAQQDIRGATVVVTLEPCTHLGKTPSCTQFLIDNNIARVVIGCIDPNPDVQGKGVEQLRAAGIDVEVGVLQDECNWANRFFFHAVTTKTPYCIAKIAQSLDGCISTNNGQSQWITSEESRRRVHALRADVDAVVVGRKTALSDDPELTVRLVHGKNPHRIIVDTNLSLPLSLKVFTDALRTQTTVFCSTRASLTRKAETLRIAGVNILSVDELLDGKISLESALRQMYSELSMQSILVEGGAHLLSSMVSQNLVDELHTFIAPCIIGNGKQAYGHVQTPSLQEAYRLRFRSMSSSGNDIHIVSQRHE